MSKEFIEAQHNKDSIHKAAEQEEQLNYFLISELQSNRLDQKYLTQWAERNYQTDDYFHNWLRMILKPANFLLFLNYIRYPLPSAKLAKIKIEPQLKRVFVSEDADFKYNVQGKEKEDYIEDLKIKEFTSELFQKIIYKHNSLVVCDLDPVTPNKPERYFIDIGDVVSIKERKNKVWKIAFKATLNIDGADKHGYLYIDDNKYEFYDDKKIFVVKKNHDLGYTPVHFIVPNKFKGDFIIRESVYTYIRKDLEDYTFLKTLQSMVTTSGTIPIITKIDTSSEEENEDQNTNENGEPAYKSMIGSQKAEVNSQNNNVSSGEFQPGTVHSVSLEDITDSQGKINIDAVKYFVNYHRIPVDTLDHLNKRVQELEENIQVTLVGDIITGSEEAKNIPQIQKSISVLENTLTNVAEILNRIRKLSDTDMLGLKYGIKRVNEVFIHFGTDFFLDSESKLIDDFNKAPNSLERKNIIVRINKNRYKNNPEILSRQDILYNIMPYVSDKDFELAIQQQAVSDINKEYQLRFDYWIQLFEAQYGDIVTFFKMLEDKTKAIRIKVINDLVIQIIKTNTEGELNNSANNNLNT